MLQGGLVLLGWNAEIFGRDLQLLAHGGAEDLVVGVLKYIAHPAGKLADGLFFGIRTCHQHLSGCGAKQAVEMPDQRGLAAAVLPHDGNDLVFIDGHVHPF